MQKPMLSIDGLSVNIGPTPILRDIGLEVLPGSMCGLIGRNGAGKTTLMRSIMGLLKAREGTIRFEDQDVTRIQGYKRAHMGIGFMPEDRGLVPQLTAEENILLPVWSTGADDSKKRLEWIYGLMEEVAAFRHRGANELSGGQQKFVAFARALMAGRRLLLLDEPSEGIAPVFASRMVEIMADLKAAGEAVLVAESNDTHINHILDNTYVIERGSVSENSG